MKKRVIALLLCMSPTLAAAEPVTVAGLNIAMSLDEARLVVEDKGFNCAELTREVHCGEPINETIGYKEGWDLSDAILVTGVAAILVPKGDELSAVGIGCRLINACDYTVRQLAQALVDNDIINALEGGVDNDGNTFYTGVGPSGDAIRVNSFGGGPTIVVERGSYGSGGLQLN